MTGWNDKKGDLHSLYPSDVDEEWDNWMDAFLVPVILVQIADVGS